LEQEDYDSGVAPEESLPVAPPEVAAAATVGTFPVTGETTNVLPKFAPDHHWRENEAKRSSYSSRVCRERIINKSSTLIPPYEDSEVGAFHHEAPSDPPQAAGQDLDPPPSARERQWREKEVKRSMQSSRNRHPQHIIQRSHESQLPSDDPAMPRVLVENRLSVVASSSTIPSEVANEDISEGRSTTIDSSFSQLSTFTQDAQAVDLLSSEDGDSVAGDLTAADRGEGEECVVNNMDVEQPGSTQNPVRDENLAVANPVTMGDEINPNIPVAETFDADALATRRRQMIQKTRCWSLIGCFVFLGVILIILFVVVLGV
jgi:hypothetical protein